MIFEMIEWGDAWYKDQAMSVAEAFHKCAPMKTVSMGRIVAETKEAVILSPYYYPDPDAANEIDLAICIPKGMIIRRLRLFPAEVVDDHDDASRPLLPQQ